MPIQAGAYIHTLLDVPGVVAQNNFLAVFNPVGSGALHIAQAGLVSTYAQAAATASASLTTQRITASSAGTLVAPSSVARFSTKHPDPVTQVRINNPTVTVVPAIMSAFPPVVSTGAGSGGSQQQSNPGGDSFYVYPGEGLVFATAAGDIDQVWNITYIWREIPLS